MCFRELKRKSIQEKDLEENSNSKVQSNTNLQENEGGCVKENCPP